MADLFKPLVIENGDLLAGKAGDLGVGTVVVPAVPFGDLISEIPVFPDQLPYRIPLNGTDQAVVQGRGCIGVGHTPAYGNQSQEIPRTQDLHNDIPVTGALHKYLYITLKDGFHPGRELTHFAQDLPFLVRDHDLVHLL